MSILDEITALRQRQVERGFGPNSVDTFAHGELSRCAASLIVTAAAELAVMPAGRGCALHNDLQATADWLWPFPTQPINSDQPPRQLLLNSIGWLLDEVERIDRRAHADPLDRRLRVVKGGKR